MKTTPLSHFNLVALALAILGMVLVSGPLRAEPPVMSAPDAYELTQKEELLLVDIRSRQEWRQTGVAETAYTISMHEAGFIEKLAELRQSHPDKPVAIICATGGRTAWLQNELEKRGIGGIIDVSEGMMGKDGNPGWIKRGLPTKKFEG